MRARSTKTFIPLLVVWWTGCRVPEETSVPPPPDIGARVRQVLAEAKHPHQTGSALEALQALGPSAVPALLEALESDGIYVRETAARALGRLKEPRAVEPLLELVEQDRIEDWAALEAMASIGTPATETVLQHLERFSEDRDVASRLLQVLRASPESRALPVLLSLYPSRNEWVSTEIAETVRVISVDTYERDLAPREYERIDAAFEHDPVRFTLEACRLAEHFEPGTELLRRGLRHSEPRVRRAALACDPPLGGRPEALMPEVSSLLPNPFRERFPALVETRGWAEALKFVDAHFIQRPPRAGASEVRFEFVEAKVSEVRPFFARKTSCPPAPYTIGSNGNPQYDPEYEVIVKVPGRSAPVRGPGRWPAVNDPDVAREVTVYGEGQSTIGTLNRVEWTCADPCGGAAVWCSWEARYWTGHRGWAPDFVVPGRHQVEPVDVSGDGDTYDAGPLHWVVDGGTISAFADGSPVAEFFGDYGGPHFDVLGRLGEASTGPYVVRVVGKFWHTDAVTHRAGEAWHRHDGAAYDSGGTCEETGELQFLVPGLTPVSGYWEWPWLAAVARKGRVELVWEPSTDAGGDGVLFRTKTGEVGPVLTADFGEGCDDVSSGKGWPAPGSSCAFGLGEHKRYRLTSIASEGRYSLVLEREAPIAARQEFLLLAPGVAPSRVSLVFAGDLDDDGHVDLIVSAPWWGSSTDRQFELLMSDWGERFRQGENPLLRNVAQYVGSPGPN